MLVFIIPLKSKRVSKDWGKVNKLIERCVSSIINQTTEAFKTVIVCHEKPETAIQHPSIHYVQVDFPPPELGTNNAISQMDRDKNRKMWIGIEYAKQFNPLYIMFVDVDDCVSCHLAEFVNQHPSENGWFFDSGYFYIDGSQRIYRKNKKFYLMSGTSHIVKYSLMQDESIHLIYIDSGEPLHQIVVDLFFKRGEPLKALPFPGAVYIVSNGENINADKTSDRSGRESIKTQIKDLILKYPRKARDFIHSQALGRQIAEEFCLEWNNKKSLSKGSTTNRV